MPRFSIIVPVLDEARAIEATLASLQPWRASGEAEVIVVDGASRDDTRLLAAPLADRVIEAPRGRATQMNAGAAAARGEILLFLHSDTRLPANALDAARDALAATDRDWGRFDVIIDGASAWLGLVAATMNIRSRLTGIATGDQAMFVRRAAFESVHGFPSIPLMEDVALSKALKHRTLPSACVNARSPRGAAGSATARCEPSSSCGACGLLLRSVPIPIASHGPMTSNAPRADTMRVAVFAKAPVAGEVKTRLASLLGAAGAAKLHAALVRRTLATARRARLGPVELWCHPDEKHPFFAQCREEFGVALMRQRGADLGARMANAFRHAHEKDSALVLIGSDCPALSVARLRAVARALKGRDAVLTPAEDGGYVLVALSRPAPIFEAIAWGGPTVMAETRRKLETSGLDWKEMPKLWDVDRPEDYARLQATELGVGARA